jgi:sulfonate transport system permease protein
MRRRGRIVLRSRGGLTSGTDDGRRVEAAAGAAVRVVLTAGTVIALWWVLSVSGAVGGALLPSPAEVARGGLELITRGGLPAAAAVSTTRVLIGFALGAAAGTALSRFGRTPDLLLRVVRVIPSVIWMPLVLVYGGVSDVLQVVFVATGALFATVAGSLRRALAQSWVFVIAAESFNASSGLGSLLLQAGGGGRTDQVFAVLLLVVLLAGVSDGVAVLLGRLVQGARRRRMTRRFVA